MKQLRHGRDRPVADAPRVHRRAHQRAGDVPRLLVVLFLVAAVFGTVAASRRDTVRLRHRVGELEDRLAARRGELNLVRLQLGRLSAVYGYSADHRISADLAAAIYDVALAEGVEPTLAFSLISVESGFASRAVSSAGAVGLTQVLPSTAAWLEPGIGYAELFDRETNLRLGFRYLKRLLEQYDGDLHLALLAYNRGPARIDSIRGSGGDPSNGYSQAVQTEMLSR